VQGGETLPSLPEASHYALLLEPDGTILAANETLAERLGLPLSQLQGRCLFDLFPPGVAEFRRSVAEESARTGTSRSYQDVSRSGHILDVLVQPVLGAGGAVAALAVFVSDITGQWKTANERLRLATAVEQAAEAVVLIENDWTIGYVNQAFEDMTGYSQSEVSGKPMAMLYHGRHQERAYADIRAVLEEGDVWTGRTFHTVKDGRRLRVEKTVSPIRGQGGVVLGSVSVWRDVTRVAALERQLREAQKMEAIATLAGGIAHDFNNVLGPIVLHAELGLTLLPEDSPVRMGLTEILGATHRAKALVEQILALSRRGEAEEPVRFRLSDILGECIKFLRPSLPATIDIVFDKHTEDDTVLADPTQIHQVIMNLCTNAAYAMRQAGGVLRLELNSADMGTSRQALFSESEFESGVLLTVSDTGEGIAPDCLGRIFDPFYTTRQRGGTGLGLTVVQGIVTGRLGGGVCVESELGKGTAFHVLLPREQSIKVEGGEPLPHGSPRGRGERVLLVEDETPLRESTELVLHSLGYEVTACPGPLVALERFAEQSGAFDLVLADVTMPGMTGVEMLRRIRVDNPYIPALLVSGYSEIVTPELLRGLGAEFLRKPYSVEGLAIAVRGALDRACRNARE